MLIELRGSHLTVGSDCWELSASMEKQAECEDVDFTSCVLAADAVRQAVYGDHSCFTVEKSQKIFLDVLLLYRICHSYIKELYV